jgi:hypothetical protein
LRRQHRFFADVEIGEELGFGQRGANAFEAADGLIGARDGALVFG